MGVQDTGCLRSVPAGHGVIREYNGRCTYYRVNQFVSPNFRMREFHPTGVRPYGVMRKLVDQLQAMRYSLGVPIIITSAYRSGSTHASGLAADISVQRKSFIQVAQAAYNAGFRRIEVVKRSGSYWNNMSVGGHVHVDVYDGSGNNTRGTIYDCPTCRSLPCYPWYAFGVSGRWWATSQPNTFSQLMANLRADRGNTGYQGC